jgi:hypothetical protein
MSKQMTQPLYRASRVVALVAGLMGLAAADGAGATEREASEGDVAKYAREARESFDELLARLDPYLEPLRQEAEPVTRRLPGPIRQFLDAGGWWLIVLVLGVVALFWVRSLVERLRVAISRPRPPRARWWHINPVRVLHEDLAPLAVTYTEPGPRVLSVYGQPARLRLVVMAPAERGVGELDESMADRLLDCIEPGLGEVAAADYPRVRIWPRQAGPGGFAAAFQRHVPFPGRPRRHSHWIRLTGVVRVGRHDIDVGLALYADTPNRIGSVAVRQGGWLEVLGTRQAEAV